MAHKRVLIPTEFASGKKLTADMVAIGMRFAADPSSIAPNIEDTIVAASIEGMQSEDYRVLSLLVDWFGIHYERVNVDRLVQMVHLIKDDRVKALWKGLAQWKKRDWRFKKLQKVYTKARLDLMGEGTDFQLQRHGEDERFVGTALRVPSKLLRHRPEDILTPQELAIRHSGYFYRVTIGPSYRADMWALIEQHPEYTPAEIARNTYGSFPTAWGVRRDWMILHGSANLRQNSAKRTNFG